MKISIKLSIASSFIIMILLSGGITTTLSYINNKKAISSCVKEIMNRYKDQTITQSLNYVKAAQTNLKFCQQAVKSNIIIDTPLKNIKQYFDIAINENPQFHAFYFGDNLGYFLMTQKMPDNTKSTNWTYQKNNKIITKWKHQNSKWETYYPLLQEENISSGFKPYEMLWYKNAVKNKQPAWSDLHIISDNGATGFTCSSPIYDHNGDVYAVLGIDIDAKYLSKYMKKIAPPKSMAFIITDKKDIVALYNEENNQNIILSHKTSSNNFTLLNVNDMNNKIINHAINIWDKNKNLDNTSFEFSNNNKTYLAIISKFPNKCPWNWTIGIAIPEEIFLSQIKKQTNITISLCLILILISIISGYILSNKISSSLLILENQMTKIKNLDLNYNKPVSSFIKEIDQMANSFYNMIKGLISFKKYVPSELVRELIQLDQVAQIGGEKKFITLFFSDIENFTSISEKIPPEELLDKLSQYLSQINEIIAKNNGTIDKYIGDSVMAFWGAPKHLEDHALLTCKAALESLEAITMLNREWEKKDKIIFNTRIGIHSGTAVVGNIGSNERMNYTAIGDNVNIASRLESINKEYGTNIIISEATYNLVKDKIKAKYLGKTKVKGKTQMVSIYELQGLNIDMV